MMSTDVDIREGVYCRIYRAALAVARNQQPGVAGHAEDIAQGVVLKFTKRHMTARVENPAAWGAVHARYACINFANRELGRERNANVDSEDFWNEQIDLNPRIYPYKSVAGADAIEYALSCLSDRERELVHLVEAGYSHGEIAQMMGYAGPRSVTTTMSRVRSKIVDHLGGMDEVVELLTPEMMSMCSIDLESIMIASTDDRVAEEGQDSQ